MNSYVYTWEKKTAIVAHPNKENRVSNDKNGKIFVGGGEHGG